MKKSTLNFLPHHNDKAFSLTLSKTSPGFYMYAAQVLKQEGQDGPGSLT